MRERIAASDWIKLVVTASALAIAPACAVAVVPDAPALAAVESASPERCAAPDGCARLAAAGAAADASGGSADVSGASDTAATRRRSPLELTISGYAYHFRSIRCKHCERTDVVPGIGVQYRLYGSESSPWSARFAAGIQNDSFRHLGYYAGLTGQRVWRASWAEIEYGLGAFAMRRTFSPKGGLEWIVAPLPLISVRPYDSRWGLNVLAAPNFQHDGKRRSGFVFLQLSYALGNGG